MGTYGLPYDTFDSPLLVTVARPLLLGTYGFPFDSPLLVTVARLLVLGTYGLTFYSPLLVTAHDPFY